MAMFAFVFQPASAQDYPSKAIRLIVPFAPGGTADVLGRILAQKLNEKYKQPVVVENKPGVGGNIGAEQVSRASPDGYTLLFGTIGIHSTFNIYPNLNYDPPKDLEPIIIVADTPNVLIASKRLQLKNTKEIIEKSQNATADQALFYGSAGFGSSTHIAGELFKYESHANLSHVPYKGSGPALTDLMGGQLDVMFENLPTAMPLIQSGDVKVLSVTSDKRVASLPNVPTIAEDGLPGYVFTAWFTIAAPAGTPDPIVDKLNKDIREVMLSKDLQKRFASLGVNPVPGSRTAQQSKAFIDSETAKFNNLISDAKLTAK
ncbi:Bug family tripartite tricarboxylate transporter substrate binding protein [Advenella kashmirensis]|nr:tripartite tricarboxylate transporter substrate binding protein [Advenella kashmirensis]